MKTIKVDEVEPGPNPHGVETRKIYDTESNLSVHLRLKPGERLRRHITPVDVMFYVLAGEGVVEVGEEKKTVTQDTVIYSPAKIVHCWYNESNSDLRVLIVKTPRPRDKTVML